MRRSNLIMRIMSIGVFFFCLIVQADVFAQAPVDARPFDEGPFYGEDESAFLQEVGEPGERSFVRANDNNSDEQMEQMVIKLEAIKKDVVELREYLQGELSQIKETLNTTKLASLRASRR